MSRPSHWILGLFAIVGGVLWWTGALREYLAARPADSRAGAESGGESHRAGSDGAVGNNPGSVAVKRTASPPKAKPAMSEVTGVVVDRRGWPVVHARVRLLGDARQGGDSAVDVVETDASGRFRIRGPSAVNRMLRLEAPGRHAPLDVHGSVEDLALVMQDPLPWADSEATGPKADVAASSSQPSEDLLVGEGWVRDHAGDPAVGASVVVRETGDSTRVDEQGRFIIPLPNGAFTLVAWNTNGEVAVTDTMLPPRKQGKLPLQEVRLAAGTVLRGRLRDEDGQSLVDASIVVENAGVRRTVRSEQGGLFVVSGIVSGELRVSILPVRGHVGRRMAPMMVDGDADLGEVIVARVDRDPLRVTVIDAAGSPQPFVHVVADQGSGLCRAYAQADVKGVATFAGLGSGEAIFEVRNTNLEKMQVARWDAEEHRLIVAP